MTYRRHETEPRHVETFAVIDLDRTLLDTSTLVDMLLLQLHDHGYDARQVSGFIDFIHSRTGSSLSLREFFESSIEDGEVLYGTVKQELLQLAEGGELTDELLYAGAAELLDTLDETDVPFAILTYGDVADQDFKLSLLRMLTSRQIGELHATITTEREKARWISHTWSQDGLLHVPDDIYGHAPIVADSVVVLDDKPQNLHSESSAVRGILIDNHHQSAGSISIVELVVAIRSGVSLDDLSSRGAMSHD